MDVFTTGQYSNELLETVKTSNKREGIRVERIQPFTAEEQKLIKGELKPRIGVL